MTDLYKHWRDALALVGDCGRLTRADMAGMDPVHEDVPGCGYYRWPQKGMAPKAVAIWFDGWDGRYLAEVDGLPHDDVCEAWTWSLRDPITHETYEAVVAGAGWPDRKEDAA